MTNPDTAAADAYIKMDALWSPLPWMDNAGSLLACLALFGLACMIVEQAALSRSYRLLYGYLGSQRYSIQSNGFPSVTIPWNLFPFVNVK